MHTSDKKHNNNYGGVGGGGQQSDQHLSTGSPTNNSFNGDDRNRTTNQRRTSENQQNSFMNDRNLMREFDGNDTKASSRMKGGGSGADRNYQDSNEFSQMGFDKNSNPNS